MPHALIREQVDTRATARTIEVFHRGKRVAAHARRYGGPRHGTQPEHMPSAHRRYGEWTPERLQHQARTIGPNTEGLIIAVLAVITAAYFFTKVSHIPAPLALLAICAEFFGGLGLIVGLLARVAAFGIAANMVVAIATAHYPFGFFMNWFGKQKGEGFEYHLLAIAMAVLVMMRGAGALSLDRWLSSVAG